jgi:hypothetical protein
LRRRHTERNFILYLALESIDGLERIGIHALLVHWPGFVGKKLRNKNEERNVVFSAPLLLAVSGRKSAYGLFFVAVGVNGLSVQFRSLISTWS